MAEERVGILIEAEDKASKVFDKMGASGKRALGDVSKSSQQTSQAIQRLPEQFGKASSALMLLQGSTAAMGGEAARVATQVTGLAAIVAQGGVMGIAIAGATVAVAAAGKAWEMFTAEVVAAQAEQRAINAVFETALKRLGAMKAGVRELADEVKFYGQDSLTVAILKQWELVEANERGVASIEAELDALRLSSVAVENLSDAERSHMAGLIRIRDRAREVLAERKKGLDQLEILANKEAEREAAQERRRKATERETEALKEQAEAERERRIAIAETLAQMALLKAAVERQQVADKETRIILKNNFDQLQGELDAIEASQHQKAVASAQAWATAGQTIVGAWSAATSAVISGSEDSKRAMISAAITTAQTVIMTAAASAAAKQFESAAGLGPGVGILIGAALAAAAFGAVQAYMTKFQFGGVATGGTPGRDSVPALLTPGERVLTIAERREYERGGRGGGGINVTFAPKIDMLSLPNATQRKQLLLDLADDFDELVSGGQFARGLQRA